MGVNGIHANLLSHANYFDTFLRWFQEFDHSQFIIVPANMELGLKNRGRLLKHIQKLYGLPQMTKPWPNATRRPMLPEVSLDDADYEKIESLVGNVTGMGRLLTHTNATLLGFEGNPLDAAEVAHWIATNW